MDPKLKNLLEPHLESGKDDGIIEKLSKYDDNILICAPTVIKCFFYIRLNVNNTFILIIH